MQVRTPTLQHAVMIEAVENHMPEVIVIDEIGTELEAAAARTIAERGVQLIGTAHGNNLDNLMLNPTLSDLIGGIQTVTLGDEEARRRGPRRACSSARRRRRSTSSSRSRTATGSMVHGDVAETVDALLRGDQSRPSCAGGTRSGVHRTQARVRGRRRTSSSARERFGGLVGERLGGGSARLARRPARSAGRTAREADAGLPAGLSAGERGGWRARAGRPAHGRGTTAGVARVRGRCGGPGSAPRWRRPVRRGDIADRGPLERGRPRPAGRAARDARELDRQRAWRERRRGRSTRCRRTRAPGRSTLTSPTRRGTKTRRGRVTEDEGGPPRRRPCTSRVARTLPTLRVSCRRHQPQAARAGRPRPPAAGGHRPRRRRGRRGHDPAQEPVPPEDAAAPRGGGAGMPIYVLKSEHACRCSRA